MGGNVFFRILLGGMVISHTFRKARLQCILSLKFHIHFRNIFRDNVMYKNAQSMLSTALFITSKKKSVNVQCSLLK